MVLAETLTFAVDKQVYAPLEDVTVKFDPVTCGSEHKVKPFTDIGRVEILNPKTNQWLSSAEAWELAPSLTDQMKIRVVGISDKKPKISLEIQNTRLGKTTKLAPFSIWVSTAYKEYIGILNKTILAEE